MTSRDVLSRVLREVSRLHSFSDRNNIRELMPKIMYYILQRWINIEVYQFDLVVGSQRSQTKTISVDRLRVEVQHRAFLGV